MSPLNDVLEAIALLEKEWQDTADGLDGQLHGEPTDPADVRRYDYHRGYARGLRLAAGQLRALGGV